jgi:hypothetical protein
MYSFHQQLFIFCIAAILGHNTKAVLEASRVVGQEVNTEKTKYMVVSCHQNVQQNQGLLIANKYFENMAKLHLQRN